MTLLEKILEQKEKVKKDNGEGVAIDSIMLCDIIGGGKTQSHFYKKDSLHEMRSISKVLISLAYGIAIDRKMKVNGKPLTLKTKVFTVIEKLAQIENIDNLEKMKKWNIWTLLTYSAGYESQMFSERFIKNIKYQDRLNYVLNYPLKNEPNEKYVYNNAELFLLSVFFTEAFGENLTEFIKREIFAPLGIKTFKWTSYGKYNPGGTGLYIYHKDMFKIGQLILNKGKFNDKQIVSSTYIEKMCKSQIETPYAVKPERVLPKVGVGYIMHISRDGYSFKDGTNGQYLIVNFEKGQLITICSSEPDMKYVTEILRGII